jgi:DNA-binding PadR family transcriptional regulator
VSILSSIEELVLLAVWELDRDAYGVSIRGHVAQRFGRRLSLGAVYGSLDRLTQAGLLAGKLGDPTPARGGRRKRFFRLTPNGKSALREAKRRDERLWGRVPAIRALRSGRGGAG